MSRERAYRAGTEYRFVPKRTNAVESTLAGTTRIGLRQCFGQREELLLLLHEDLAHRAVTKARMRPGVGDLAEEVSELPVAVFDARDCARREEAVAEVANGSFDPALVRRTPRPAQPWLHAKVASDLEQAGVISNGVSAALEDDTLRIIEEPLPGHALEEGRRADEGAAKRLESSSRRQARPTSHGSRRGR